MWMLTCNILIGADSRLRTYVSFCTREGLYLKLYQRCLYLRLPCFVLAYAINRVMDMGRTEDSNLSIARRNIPTCVRPRANLVLGIGVEPMKRFLSRLIRPLRLPYRSPSIVLLHFLMCFGMIRLPYHLVFLFSDYLPNMPR